MSHGRRLVSDSLGGAVGAALAAKHSDDLVVPECKNGPSQSTNHLRLDYWVLRRSWTRPCTIGYEVKSSRADFLRDDKWRGYLPLCNELWFIATDPKAIQPEELPEGVGLYRLAGTRLVTVRKAHWRPTDPAAMEGLFTYVLMCRAGIGREHGQKDDDWRLNYWRGWLERKREAQDIGWQASKTLREKYDREVAQVRMDNDRLRKESAALASLRDALRDKGIEWRDWMTPDEVERQLNVKPWTRSRVEQAHAALTELMEAPHD